MLSKNLTKYLDDLCSMINVEQENLIYQKWIEFWESDGSGNYFIPPTRTPRQPALIWPIININDALDDPELMVLREFKLVCDQISTQGMGLLNVRCNYGTGIIATLFGCDLFIMDYKHDTLPTACALDSKEKLYAIIDSGPADISVGLGAKVWQTAELFLEVFEKYPILKQTVELYHPDLQGPIDNLEVIWGSDIFLAFYDEPQTIKSLLDIITDTYIEFLDKWFKTAPPHNDTYTVHWGLLMKGKPVLRNDSLMNLSSDTYVDIIRPCDQRIFDKFGPGCIHFCGRGDHYIESISKINGLNAINLSQPQYNDMEKIFATTIEKGIKIIGYPGNPQYLEDLRRMNLKKKGNICVLPQC